MTNAIIPRSFLDAAGAAVSPGYHNAALGVAGVAVAFPSGSLGALVHVSAGCYVGVRPSATLGTFGDAAYGSVLNGTLLDIRRGGVPGAGDTPYIHVAPWATTASVAIVFY